MKSKRVSVLVCAYNEENTIGIVLDQLRPLTFFVELICVDNGSTDNTQNIIQKKQHEDPRIKLVMVKKNCGLGHGLQQGIKATTGDVVVRQDADLEYPTSELEELIAPIINGEATTVFGSRTLGKKIRKSPYLINCIANKMFTILANLIFKVKLTDVETGAKAFQGDLIRAMPLSAKGFDIEIEILYQLTKQKMSILDIPISYNGRTKEEGKKISFKDALETLILMGKYFFKTRWSR